MKYVLLSVCIAVLAGAEHARAHFIWLELPPTAMESALIRFSEEPGEATDADMQALASPTVVKDAAGSVVVFAPGKEALEAKVSKETAVLGGTLDYGVLDKEAQGRGIFLLYYHVKAVRNISEAQKSLGLPVEVFASVAGTELAIAVKRDGKPAAKAEVTVAMPSGKELVVETNEAGQVRVEITGKGEVGVRAMVAEEKAGEAKGKAYGLVRHYSTLTFWN